MNNMECKVKNYSDSFLYNKGNNLDKSIMTFMMSAEIIDKTHPSFEDIRYEIKRRQVTSSLMKVLDSPNVILLRNNVSLSRAFKVFAAKDIISGDKIVKVFIDVSDEIKSVNGTYSLAPRKEDIIVSYLLNALTTLIYWRQPNRLLNNASLVESGTKAFTDLFFYVIDYLRVGGVDNVKERTKYMSAMYYQCGLLCKDDTDSVRQRARKISGLNQREADIVETLMGPDPFKNIDTFISALSNVLKIKDELKTDNFIDKWIFVFGAGTQFGTELFTPFASMLTNAYVGSYINNQKTIEKVLGRTTVEFTNAIFRVGSELA